MADDAQIDWKSDQDETDFFLMSNLFPEDTGLPMVVWVGDKGGARHDVRVKVNETHGSRTTPDRMAVMSVRPEPRLLHGRLSGRDVELVARWIKLNEALIIDHWEGRASSVALARRLIPLPA